MLTLNEIQTLPIGAGSIRVLASGEWTDGQHETFEFVVPPGSPGPGGHVHDDADEVFAVLEGTAEFHLGEATLIAKPGTTVVAPRGLPHHWRAVGGVTLRMVVTFTPAIGMEHYFGELSVMLARGWPPTQEEMESLWSRYDTRPA